MPFGWYLASRPGPKSRRKLARGFSWQECWTSARIWGFGFEGPLEKVRMGEPWAKKKDGILLGKPGSVASKRKNS
jgi:hypothetical protein